MLHKLHPCQLNIAVEFIEAFSMNSRQAAAANIAGCAFTKTTAKSASVWVLHDEMLRC